MAADAGTTGYLDTWKRTFGQVAGSVVSHSEIDGKRQGLNTDAVDQIDESDFACNNPWRKAKAVLNVRKAFGKFLQPASTGAKTEEGY